ncbi:hypothetical protein LXL04_034805 [Taraxacum kok-saghyz]
MLALELFASFFPVVVMGVNLDLIESTLDWSREKISSAVKDTVFQKHCTRLHSQQVNEKLGADNSKPFFHPSTTFKGLNANGGFVYPGSLVYPVVSCLKTSSYGVVAIQQVWCCV